MSEAPAPAAGQVSADGQFRWDGQNWIPIPRGEREPTAWTRPMQLSVAGLYTAQAIYGLGITLVFVNHDSMLRVLKAQGTNFPEGTDINTVVNVSVGFAIGFAVLVAILGLVAALGSYLGWRWMFWVALVIFGLGIVGALSNIRYFASPDQSPLPTGVLAVSELFSLAGVALFVWMLLGAIKYGPWAMKKPGAA